MGFVLPANAGTPGVSLEAVQAEADTLRLKVKALTELTKFMSGTRSQVRGYCYIAGKYLESIGKLDEYYKAEIAAAPTPAELVAELKKGERFEQAGIMVPSDPMTFETAATIALQLVQAEGYEPVDVADADEVDMLKRMAKAHENLARRVFASLKEEVSRAWAAKLYLESIDQFSRFKAYHTQELKQAEEKQREQEAAKQRAAEARRIESRKLRMAKEWEEHRAKQLRKLRDDIEDDRPEVVVAPGAPAAAKTRGPASTYLRTSTRLKDFRGYPGRRYHSYGTRYRRPAAPARRTSGSRRSRGGRGGRGGPRGKR